VLLILFNSKTFFEIYHVLTTTKIGLDYRRLLPGCRVRAMLGVSGQSRAQIQRNHTKSLGEARKLTIFFSFSQKVKP
jgi:hypothetical protein